MGEVGRPGMRTRGGSKILEGPLLQVVQFSLRGDWIAQKKTNQRSTRPQTSKATGLEYL